MDNLTLYRNRLIPLESVLLKDDQILYADDNRIITAWTAIKPRCDLKCGCSLYLLDKGIKISRFYDHNGAFLYWYCDIIDTNYDASNHTYIFTDLLVDIKVFPDGSVRILDLDELSEAILKNLVTTEQSAKALSRLHGLLQEIYAGTFEALGAMLLKYLPSCPDSQSN